MENIFEIEESSSEEESEDEIIDRIAQSTKFLNKVPMDKYEKNRNKLFTKQIIKRNIVIDSQSYYFGPMPGHSITKDFDARGRGEEDAYASQGFQSVDFSTSNYNVPLQLRRNVSILGLPTPNFTADHGIFTNVIGFKLKKAIIRTPVYNVNKTNNVIIYIGGFGDGYTTGSPVFSITISPGVYTAHELADVFQRYAGNEYPNTGDTFVPEANAQFCVYNIINIGEYIAPEDLDAAATVLSGQWSSSDPPEFTPNSASFTCKFMEERANDIGYSATSEAPQHFGATADNGSTDAPDIGTNPNGYYRGMGFQFGYPGNHPHPDTSGDAVTIIWNYNSITRAAAKLFGFLPQTRVSGLYQYSDKAPDLSSQYVDLVIPQIPSIACTKNSNGRDIIDRINLDKGHGEYVYYTPQEKESEIQNYFSPIRISKLQIQLYAWNNEFYDSQNSDNSFEFEITMISDKSLLA
jgi:hypothetical protein